MEVVQQPHADEHADGCELFDAGKSVTSVALEVGYSSPAAFSKMFRRVMGKRPTHMLH